MNECLNTRLLQMTNIGRGLSWFLSQHHELRIDQTKAVNHHLALDGLDGIHHHRHGTRIQRLKRRLRINIRRRQPATKPRMRVIPSHHHFRPSRLFQHVHHFGLEHRIHRLDRHGRSGLRHGKDIHTVDRVIIDKLTQHQAHDFHGNPGAAVLQHFEQRQTANVHLLGAIRSGRIAATHASSHAAGGHAAHQLLQAFHRSVVWRVFFYVRYH
mmetsp:Transcript_17976/g.48884  ORF Transcript_17976/g.48884 Transcript_17976/m.48884 type:complete len:212 (+) Transcript_17976:2631-3266(+)